MAKWRLSFVGDTHTGSTVGLAPRNGVPHPEGITIPATPTSRWLWDHYDRMLEAEAEEVKDESPDRHALIFTGDIMDGGMHHGQRQLYHPDASVEKWISERVVETAVDALMPDYIFVILGTPSHVGKGGAAEESVGKALAGKYGEKLMRPSEYRYGWPMLRLNCGTEAEPYWVDIRHHGKMGQLPHTRESYHKRYAFDIWSSQAMYKEGVPAQLAIRAHRHKYSDTGPVPPHKRTTRAIALPCFQLSTEWAMQMAFEEFPDIGMVGATIRKGREYIFPQVVYPKMEAYTCSPSP